MFRSTLSVPPILSLRMILSRLMSRSVHWLPSFP
jgi:hypothetical protein